MPCHNTPNKMQKGKRPSALKTSRSYTASSPCWSKYLAFWLTQTNSLLLSDPHMRNNCFSPAKQVLGHIASQIKQRKALQSQHWCYSSEASGVTRNRLGSSKNQSHRAARRMRRVQWSFPPPKTFLCAKNCSFWTHQQVSQWSICMAFWDWQDLRTDWSEVLLAKLEEGNWNLYSRMWCLSDFKNRPP